MTKVLELNSVSKNFEDVKAVDGISLKAEAGDFITIEGASGCGKSTLLRLIVGLIQPNTGNIILRGTKLAPSNLLDMRQRMGYVIQEGGLFTHLTVRDNVTVMARYLQRDADWIEHRLAELAQLVRLPLNLMSRFPAELSGGQRQRVSLMRALMLAGGM